MRPIALVAISAIACAEGPSDLNDVVLDGGEESTDGGTDSGPIPILERPIAGDVRCRAGIVTNLAPRVWSTPRMATSTAGAFLARSEGDQSLISRVELDRSISDPILVDRGTAIASSGAGLVVASGAFGWIRRTILDAGGREVETASIAGTGPYGFLSIAHAGASRGFAWYTGREIRVAVEQAGGGTSGAVIADLGEGVYDPSLAFAGFASGYALAWHGDDRLWFAAVDETGAFAIEPKSLGELGGSSFAFFGTETIGLLALDDGFLIAWVERYWNGKAYSTKLLDMVMINDPSGEAWAVIHVARLDASGAIADSALLSAPVKHVDAAEPALLRFGDRVAITWSQGGHIYLCGGCFPDDAENLLIFDPMTLAPLGERVFASTHPGGLIGRSSVFVGDTLLSAQRVQYHITSDPALVSFDCE